MIKEYCGRENETADMDFKDNNKFYFLNHDIGATLTGIERSALLRARMFQKHLQISPVIATAAYNPYLSIQREKLFESGLLPEGIEIINLYEFLQGIEDSSKEEPNDTYSINDNWTRKSVGDTHDYKVYDENNQLLIYHKCDIAGNLLYTNIFRDKKKIRRDTYDSRGSINRTQHLDPVSEQTMLEQFYRPDGTICLYKYYKTAEGKSTLDKIHLINRKGEITNAFGSETELISYWLQNIFSENPFNIAVIDRARIYYPALRRLNQFNFSMICILHSSHLKIGKDYMYGSLNSNYSAILEDLSQPDAVVLLTDRQRLHVTERFGRHNNLYTISHAAEKRAQVDFDTRIPKKIVYLARYAEEKQHDSLIRVFHEVVKKHPDAILDLYGQGGKKNSIIDNIKELKLQNNVFVNEYSVNVNEIYDTASLAVLPSKVEGFPLFLLEALSHGCPIVSYNIDYGPDDLVDHGVTGYLIEPQNEPEMAKRIIELLDDRDKLREMSQSAYVKAESFYSGAIAKRWSILIDHVLKNKRCKQEERCKLLASIENETRKDNILFETFQREDGSIGNGWITAGTFGIADGRARVKEKKNNKAIKDIGVSDFELTACIDSYLTGELFLIFRASDINNYIRCGRTGDNYFVAQNVEQGRVVSRFIKSNFIPSDGDYLTIRCEGSDISIYINGTLIANGVSDYNRKATHIGMQCCEPANYFGQLSARSIR